MQLLGMMPEDECSPYMDAMIREKDRKIEEIEQEIVDLVPQRQQEIIAAKAEREAKNKIHKEIILKKFSI
jgi:hypothetical protein